MENMNTKKFTPSSSMRGNKYALQHKPKGKASLCTQRTAELWNSFLEGTVGDKMDFVSEKDWLMVERSTESHGKQKWPLAQWVSGPQQPEDQENNLGKYHCWLSETAYWSKLTFYMNLHKQLLLRLNCQKIHRESLCCPISDRDWVTPSWELTQNNYSLEKFFVKVTMF